MRSDTSDKRWSQGPVCNRMNINPICKSRPVLEWMSTCHVSVRQMMEASCNIYSALKTTTKQVRSPDYLYDFQSLSYSVYYLVARPLHQNKITSLTLFPLANELQA